MIIKRIFLKISCHLDAPSTLNQGQNPQTSAPHLRATLINLTIPYCTHFFSFLSFFLLSFIIFIASNLPFIHFFSSFRYKVSLFPSKLKKIGIFICFLFFLYFVLYRFLLFLCFYFIILYNFLCSPQFFYSIFQFFKLVLDFFLFFNQIYLKKIQI